MAQFLRPDSNVTQTGFTGGFAEIDEATASDADKAFTLADKTTKTLEVGLTNPGTPGSGTTTVRYRIAKQTSGGALDAGGDAVTVDVAVYQGGTLIASDAQRTATGAWTAYSFTPNMAAVTDWSDVRLRFTVNASGGGGGANRRAGAISWAEMETPDALAAITGTLAATDGGTDTFAATGTVADPASTGTLAATETGADTFEGAGNVPIAGGLSAAESGNDTAAGSGSVAIAGTLTGLEAGADTFAGTGSLAAAAITGTMGALEAANDNFAGAGAVPVTGTLSALEAGADTFLGQNLTTTGAMAAIERWPDIFTGSAVLVRFPVRSLPTSRRATPVRRLTRRAR